MFSILYKTSSLYEQQGKIESVSQILTVNQSVLRVKGVTVAPRGKAKITVSDPDLGN